MSDCGVCIGLDYGDCDGYPEIQEVRWPRAKKEHRCGECNRAIAKGENYQRCSGKFDGEFYDEKTCAQCAEIRSALSCEAWPVFGEMWNEIEEFAFPQMTTTCFDKLSTVAAKELLRSRWMAWKGLAA